MILNGFLLFVFGVDNEAVPKLAPPEPINRGGGGGAQKGGPVNSQYVVLFAQRMIKVP